MSPSARWLRPFVIFLALVTYLPTLRYGFIGLDDLVLTNYFVYFSDPANLLRVFAHDVMTGAHLVSGHFRPVLETYWIIISCIDRIVFDAPDALVFHAGGCVLHAIATYFLYRLLKTLAHDDASATLWSAAFAMHPLVSSAVGWVCGCNESLFAICALLACTAFVRLWQAGEQATRKQQAACAAQVFLLACCKESALPLLAVWLVFAPRALVLQPRWPRDVLLVAAPVVLWAVLRANALGDDAHGVALGDLAHCIASAAVGVPLYFFKVLWPATLAAMSPLPNALTLTQGFLLAGAQLVILALLPPRARLALGWFAACTALTFLLTRDGVSLLRDDRAYAATLGIFVVAPNLAAMPRARWALAAVTVLLAGVTARYLPTFTDMRSYYTRVSDENPNYAEGHLRLGDAAFRDRNYEQAETAYRRALQLNPTVAQVHNNLGVCLMNMGRTDEALAALLEETRLYPAWDVAWGNLGHLQTRLGAFDAAEQSSLRAVFLNNDNGFAYRTLATLYATRGEQQKLGIMVRNLERLRMLSPG